MTFEQIDVIIIYIMCMLVTLCYLFLCFDRYFLQYIVNVDYHLCLCRTYENVGISTC